MPSFEQEALLRARQLRRPGEQERIPKPEEQRPSAAPAGEKPAEKSDPKPLTPRRDFFGSLMKDSEKSLILILILLLMDEASDPALLLALGYLVL